VTATERSENSRVLIIRMIRPPSLLIVSFTTLMWGAGVQMPSPMPQPSHLLSLEREPPHPPPGVLLKSQGRGQQKVRLFGSSTELFLVLILSLPIIKYIHLNTSIPNVTTTTPSPLTNTTPKCTTTEAQARSNTDTPNPSADDTTARVTADAPVHLNTNISNSFVDDIVARHRQRSSPPQHRHLKLVCRRYCRARHRQRSSPPQHRHLKLIRHHMHHGRSSSPSQPQYLKLVCHVITRFVSEALRRPDAGVPNCTLEFGIEASVPSTTHVPGVSNLSADNIVDKGFSFHDHILLQLFILSCCFLSLVILYLHPVPQSVHNKALLCLR